MIETGDRVKNEAGNTGTVTMTFDDRAQVKWDDGFNNDGGKFYSINCLEKI